MLIIRKITVRIGRQIIERKWTWGMWCSPKIQSTNANLYVEKVMERCGRGHGFWLILHGLTEENCESLYSPPSPCFFHLRAFCFLSSLSACFFSYQAFLMCPFVLSFSCSPSFVFTLCFSLLDFLFWISRMHIRFFCALKNVQTASDSLGFKQSVQDERDSWGLQNKLQTRRDSLGFWDTVCRTQEIVEVFKTNVQRSRDSWDIWLQMYRTRKVVEVPNKNVRTEDIVETTKAYRTREIVKVSRQSVQNGRYRWGFYEHVHSARELVEMFKTNVQNRRDK